MPSAVPQPAQTMNQQEPSKKASSMKVSDLEIRFLEATDYHNGFLQCLEFLTKVGPVTEHQFLGMITKDGSLLMFDRATGDVSEDARPVQVKSCC